MIFKLQSRENVIKVRFSESLNDRANKRIQDKLVGKGRKADMIYLNCFRLFLRLNDCKHYFNFNLYLFLSIQHDFGKIFFRNCDFNSGCVSRLYCLFFPNIY